MLVCLLQMGSVSGLVALTVIGSSQVDPEQTIMSCSVWSRGPPIVCTLKEPCMYCSCQRTCTRSWSRCHSLPSNGGGGCVSLHWGKNQDGGWELRETPRPKVTMLCAGGAVNQTRTSPLAAVSPLLTHTFSLPPLSRSCWRNVPLQRSFHILSC